MSEPSFVVVLTSVGATDAAHALVTALLERRLIGCGTMLPGARSLYRWEGRVADEAEVVLLLKTRAERVEQLMQAFGELHPYAVPELLVLPSRGGLPAYLSWLDAETRAGATGGGE